MFCYLSLAADENIYSSRTYEKVVHSYQKCSDWTKYRKRCAFFDIFLNSTNDKLNYNVSFLIAGQFGQVYLGTLLSDDLPQGKPVAIKTVKTRKYI